MNFGEWFKNNDLMEYKFKKPPFNINGHGGDRKKGFKTAVHESRPLKPTAHLVRRQFAPFLAK